MTVVKILTLDGKISSESYTVVNEKPDRKGCLLLRGDNDEVIKVNKRRVLTEPDNSVVITSGDRARVTCPHCTNFHEILDGDNQFECPTHGIVSFSVHHTKRKKEKVMSETQENVATEVEPKVVPTVDFEALKAVNGLEVWTKKGVVFDHAKIDVQSHTLLMVDEDGKTGRKLCFNTYDGTFGRKATAPPIEAFIANAPGGKWYAVADATATRNKLTKTGYERIS